MIIKALVVVPLPENFSDNVEELKGIGMRYNSERRCWFGEVSVEDVKHVATVIGEFLYDPLSDWGPEIINKIDSSCDFMLVGRKNN